MTSIDIVDLSSDDECGELHLKAVKSEPPVVGNRIQQEESKFQQKLQSENQFKMQESKENRSSNVLSTGQSCSSILDQGQSPVDDSSLSSTSPTCPAPLCRQFWKAGNYNDGLGSKVSLQNGKNYLLVHPMFLHSNATSHKWAFGAVAELLDNAVDEIRNGATFVVVDKTTNPRDGSPALLIQDDGGGMDPEAMRQCMSFGFSDKKPKSAIGQYGNGFKTSTMRLGADVIVFRFEMEDKGLRADHITYNILIGALCQEGESRKAAKLLNVMFKVGLSPSHVTYNTLMDGFCMEGNLKAALNVRMQMENKGRRANVVTYNVLIKGFCRKGKLKDANELLNEMLERGLIPNWTTYEIVREEMMEKGFIPDIEGHLYNVSISS